VMSMVWADAEVISESDRMVMAASFISVLRDQSRPF
jgi:hypothetical protein